jgi:hypothetical protein
MTNNLKRFDIELLVIHPTLDPSEIGTALGLEAAAVQGAGDQRQTPAGRLLQGRYADTRWRYSRRYETSEQWFVDRLSDFVSHLERHDVFLRRVRSTGGRVCLLIQFLGDGYFGDEISLPILERLAKLELDLGIECFAEPQRG